MVALRRDIHDNLDVRSALHTATISSSTTTVGQVIDTLGFGALEFLFSIRAFTDGVYTPLLEESTALNMSGSNVVDSTNMFGTTAAVAAALVANDAVAKLGYKVTTKRYVRLSIVSTVVTTGATGVNSLAVLMNPTNAPVA